MGNKRIDSIKQVLNGYKKGGVKINLSSQLVLLL